MIEKVYRIRCECCGLKYYTGIRQSVKNIRDDLKVLGWKYDRQTHRDICPACQGLVGNVHVIPEGENSHAHRH